MPQPGFRQLLSMPELLQEARHCFEKVVDEKNNCAIPLVDNLMAGLAVFGLKYPSLLQFDQDQNVDIIRFNLESLYDIQKASCDTYLRERLDEVDPKNLCKTYTSLLAILQRGKGLEGFAYMDDHYLLSIDGTGYFFPQRWIAINAV